MIPSQFGIPTSLNVDVMLHCQTLVYMLMLLFRSCSVAGKVQCRPAKYRKWSENEWRHFDLKHCFGCSEVVYFSGKTFQFVNKQNISLYFRVLTMTLCAVVVVNNQHIFSIGISHPRHQKQKEMASMQN